MEDGEAAVHDDAVAGADETGGEVVFLGVEAEGGVVAGGAVDLGGEEDFAAVGDAAADGDFGEAAGFAK